MITRNDLLGQGDGLVDTAVSHGPLPDSEATRPFRPEPHLGDVPRGEERRSTERFELVRTW